MAITRLSLDGYGARPAGDFSGKTPLAVAEFDVLRAVRTLCGAAIVRVGGANGPGRGYLMGDATGTRLRWRAPRSTAAGEWVRVDADGTYVLLDGEDPDRWIEVQVVATALRPAAWVEPIELAEVYGSPPAIEDLDAAQAAAGRVSQTTLTLSAPAGLALANTTAWLDPHDAATYELSWDGTAWHAPHSEAEALATLGTQTIPAGGSVALYVRRTIAAGAAATPRRLVVLHASCDDGAGGRAHSSVRGLYRIANAAEYRFYATASAPIPGQDAPYAVSPTLPATPTPTLADGSYYVGVTWFNGYIESGLRSARRLIIAAGQQATVPPSAPHAVQIRAAGSGTCLVEALYDRTVDVADGTAADTWALWWTTNGSDPNPAGAPNAQVTMTFAGGVATLRYAGIPAQAHGTLVRVLVRARIAAGPTDSENLDIVSTTVRTVGPASGQGAGIPLGEL